MDVDGEKLSELREKSIDIVKEAGYSSARIVIEVNTPLKRAALSLTRTIKEDKRKITITEDL